MTQPNSDTESYGPLRIAFGILMLPFILLLVLALFVDECLGRWRA